MPRPATSLLKFTMDQRTSLTDSVRARLEASIESGELMPGDAVDERELALKIGVSRTPVREAVQQLQSQGLIQVVPRQGIYVARMSIKSLLGLFELLAELEAACAKYAARRISTSGKTALRVAQEKCEHALATDDAMAYELANMEFHQAIYDSANNRFLVEQVLLIRRRTKMYRRNAFQQAGRMQTSVVDHAKMLEAIVAGDHQRAWAEALEHISIGGRGFADFAASVPEALLDPRE